MPGPSQTDYVFDARDRITFINDFEVVFDANGNTTLLNGLRYQYDWNDRLVSRKNALEQKELEYSYDADGNCVRKVVYDPATGGALSDTRFLIDEINPTGYAQALEELDANGAVRRVYTYGHQRISMDQLVDDGQGGEVWQASWYGYDGQNNVRFLTDITGDVTDEYDYDSYGNLLRVSGDTPNTMLFHGEQYDADLGLYYMRARWYDPALGRFWSMDKFGGMINEPASLHKYQYANFNPASYHDPSGYYAFTLQGVVWDFAMLDSVRKRVDDGWSQLPGMYSTMKDQFTVFAEQRVSDDMLSAWVGNYRGRHYGAILGKGVQLGENLYGASSAGYYFSAPKLYGANGGVERNVESTQMIIERLARHLTKKYGGTPFKSWGSEIGFYLGIFKAYQSGAADDGVVKIDVAPYHNAFHRNALVKAQQGGLSPEVASALRDLNPLISANPDGVVTKFIGPLSAYLTFDSVDTSVTDYWQNHEMEYRILHLGEAFDRGRENFYGSLGNVMQGVIQVHEYGLEFKSRMYGDSPLSRFRIEYERQFRNVALEGAAYIGQYLEVSMYLQKMGMSKENADRIGYVVDVVDISAGLTGAAKAAPTLARRLHPRGTGVVDDFISNVDEIARFERSSGAGNLDDYAYVNKVDVDMNNPVRKNLSEATDVFKREKLRDDVNVFNADAIWTRKGEMINGVTVSRKGTVTEVTLLRKADAVTYLDEGGHLAGFRKLGDEFDHKLIYSHIFDTPDIRTAAIKFIQKMHPNIKQRRLVYKRLVLKKKQHGIRKVKKNEP